MIDLSAIPLLITLPVCFLAGLFIGYGYFRALRATADLIVQDGQPLLGLALTLGRLSLLVTGFFIAVLAGGFALLATFAGLLCAKALMLYRMQKEAI
ncbi:F1-F0 ATPase (N-ATPase) AtpR subunit [Yoonia maritima]|uniref:F1-F0 ATPase (N-ATPase) AtpR subunit n=1 Tax=Yoonia maritima TaxID=1435347 RepID=A0A2T0W531_9RHOB|nr:ATP synthase subunit I [Yoonia maritima]PRY80537.1 F1-F0 ATPase (N-ATPase) AtpR subunit [Yoonia maritima]